MTRPARLDPIVVPFDPATRQRVPTLRDVPALHVARDPRDVIDDSPAIARRGRTLTEAIRAYADAQVYPAAPILAAADRERRLAALIADATMPDAQTIAILDRLTEAHGVVDCCSELARLHAENAGLKARSGK